MRSMILFTTLAITILGPLLAKPAIALPPHARNFSSHLPEFFRDLLADRVFVHERNGAPAAIHYRKDGSFYACWLAEDAYFRRSPKDATWKIGTRTRPNNIHHRTHHSKFGEQFMRRVVIYTPDTGRLHFEAYYKKPNEWRIDRDGWIQDAWPRILVDNCRDLDLPKNFPIHETQTAYRFQNFKKHADPIRNYPGSNHRFPGATGVAAANNGPTLTPNSVEAALRSYERNIVVSVTGKQYVLHASEQTKELWSLDSELNVIDLGMMSTDPYNSLIITKWHRSNATSRLRFGYPLPLISTGRAHPVFLMMNSVLANGGTVAIPNRDAAKTDHVFQASGTVRTADRTGTWRISAGKVEVTLDHLTHAYPWRVFAGFTGWKSD